MTQREAHFAAIYAAEYAAAEVTYEKRLHKGKAAEEQIKRRIAIKKLAAVCHDRRIIAKVSGIRLANVKMYLGDDNKTWPKESEKGCA